MGTQWPCIFDTLKAESVNIYTGVEGGGFGLLRVLMFVYCTRAVIGSHMNNS